jgi:cytochrome c553
MLRRILKFALLGITSILLIVALFYAFVHFSVNKRLDREYAIQPKSISIPTDSASLALGHHLSLVQGCQDCHGADLSGQVMIDDPAIGLVSATNLTTGKGGIGSHYTDEDWLLAMRHGLNQKHQSLLLMPSTEFCKLSDRDLGALIAYCKQVPPVDQELPENELRPLGRMLVNFDQMKILTAELIDHEYQPPVEVVPAASAAYGQYLAASCAGCHGQTFKGLPGKEPGSPDASDITKTGNIGKWTEVQFRQVLRTGNTPEGKSMDPKLMPWEAFRHFSDDEIKALYLYLHNLE